MFARFKQCLKYPLIARHESRLEARSGLGVRRAKATHGEHRLGVNCEQATGSRHSRRSLKLLNLFMNPQSGAFKKRCAQRAVLGRKFRNLLAQAAPHGRD